MTANPHDAWSGDFGRAYTDRNPRDAAEIDVHYKRTFGVTRTELNAEFLETLDRSAHILEVGCNVGAQLRVLHNMGFRNLVGVEVQWYALRQGRDISRTLHCVQAIADGLPFADASFDLAFTSGVLIHIPPIALDNVMNEIHRVARRYIWGWEYFSDEPVEVAYRGQTGLLWKRNFAQGYLDRFSDLRLVAERRVPYLESANMDSMFLLTK